MGGKKMILDGHIHMNKLGTNTEGFKARLSEANVDGGVIISKSPDCFRKDTIIGESSWKSRLADVIRFTEGEKMLFPFFWIDPLETDADEQVRAACDYGVKGFKVICDHYYPYDEKAMRIYNLIANKEKPILFHTGILWDGKPSGLYTRPFEYEALIAVNGLKFAVAHVSWPWYDECIAVYGKFLNAYSRRKDLSVEMFIDTTPGTPVIYRNEVLTKLLTVGYDVLDNIIFGTDCNTSEYNVEWLKEWLNIDGQIYSKINLKEEDISRINGENLLRFLGKSKNEHKKVIPLSAV